MWKTYCPLLLMLCTFDFPRGRLAAAEPVRASAGLVNRDDDTSHRKEIRRWSDSRDENSAGLVGKWRNNGEALEPKWRDGDTVPLLPFSQFSRFSRDEIDNTEAEDDDYEHRETKHRQINGRETLLRSRNSPRLLPRTDYEDYETIGNRRGHREREEALPRKRNRSRVGEDPTVFKETGTTKEEHSKDLKKDKETILSSYRETFQVRPNDYEHEFNDDEYLKPRPRKRRPPQNYEFALAENETLLNTKDSEPWSRVNNQESSQESTSKNSKHSRNAMELKSLLKMQQEEGLSLSEILQRRNLTLNDLLKGKADVINALRMKDVDMTEDYIEEATKIMSNSFVKLSTTKRPEWIIGTESMKAINSHRDLGKEGLVISIVSTGHTLRKNRTNTRIPSAIRVNDEVYLGAGKPTTGKSVPANVDPTRGKVVTTPVPLPVATNSMELLQADDATAKSQNDGEIKMESFDEDEIMEFSDFTDYKKGRNGASPVWLVMKSGELNQSAVGDSKGQFEDKGSTLSIEKILSPTERSKSANNLSLTSENEKQYFDHKSEKFKNKGEREIVEHSESKFNHFPEKEYQSDAPVYYEPEHRMQTGSSIDESDTNKMIIKEIETALDAISHTVNSTGGGSQTFSRDPPAEKNGGNNTMKDHEHINTTEKKNYDVNASKVEPDARAEIFELFASGSAGKRLERLLKSRNMSLEELIELRQRGSSKIHLAEVSRLKAQKSNDDHRIKDTSSSKEGTTMPIKEDLADQGRAIASHENDYDKGTNHFLPKSTENIGSNDSPSNSMNPVYHEENTTEQLLSHLESKVKNEDANHHTVSETDNERENIKEKHRTVQIVDLLTTFGSLPFMKDIQRDLAGQYDNEDKRKQSTQTNNLSMMFVNNEAETIRVNDSSNVMESGFVREVVKQEPNSIDIQTVYSETSNVLVDDENRSEKGKALMKVKPSIIASGAILGVTLVVFLAIFIICRIRQKQKYRYRNTFSRAVFQGPMMAARKLSNSSSLSTVMVNVVATSTTKRPERNETIESQKEMDSRSDIDNDSLDANDSWETIPDYMK
ncbi:uncharacterized protein LOC143424664 [Xylocopa sonorina]|uniref:uncharacterized protein LOC143424664 n=1 Tax=Xylocopa sonorina TaxID=1818115 RepID=UPI00403B00B6